MTLKIMPPFDRETFFGWITVATMFSDFYLVVKNVKFFLLLHAFLSYGSLSTVSFHQFLSCRICVFWFGK